MKTTPSIVGTVRHEPDVHVTPASRCQAKSYRPDGFVAFGFEGAAFVNPLQLADPVSIGSRERNNDEFKGCDGFGIGGPARGFDGCHHFA